MKYFRLMVQAVPWYRFVRMWSKPKERFSFENFPPEGNELHWTKKLKFWCEFMCLQLNGVLKELVWSLQSFFRLEPGYSALRSRLPGWNGFFVEHVYRRLEDCYSRPISSSPGSSVTVVRREREDQGWLYPWRELKMTDEGKGCINLASYNYLGFGNVDPICTPMLMEHIKKEGLSTGATKDNPEGSYTILQKLETSIADFLGKEEALLIGMGFATNSAIISALIDSEGDGRGCLVISDSFNHNSIVEGIRLSGAKVKVFKHNDMIDLEAHLKQACEAPKKWRKILVIVEGIYSMHGDFSRLREICALKKRYGAYLYLDEAHSIGAIGETGRGVTELMGVSTKDVDVMMGTFSKSFGSQGGYIAGDSCVIENLRHVSAATVFGVSMSPACAAQIHLALDIIKNDWDRGKKKLEAIKRNSNYFRQRLIKMGFYVLGDMDSPVVPILLNIGCLQEFSDWLLNQGVAVVVVMYPAVPVLASRARFCISSSHTMKQLDYALDKIQEVGVMLNILFCKASPRYVNTEYQTYIRTVTMDLPPYQHKPIFESLASRPVEKCHISERGPETSFCIQDPQGFIADPPEKLYDSIEQHLQTKGFGSCGPRLLYGTTVQHLKLEKALATFFSKDSCLLFSHGISTTTSVIKALLQKHDVVFCYYKAHYGIKAGLKLANAKIIFFADLPDLKQKLLDMERSLRRDYSNRYIISEGIFACDGTICDLPRLIELKRKYKMLLVIDEMLSFGSIGLREVIDYHNDKNCSLDDLDIVLGSLELAMGSIGGFCCTNQDLARYLRIFASGYCYSATSPALSAIWVDEILEKYMGVQGDTSRFDNLQRNVSLFHKEIESNHTIQNKCHVQGDHYLVYLRPKTSKNIKPDIYIKFLKKVQQIMKLRIEIWKCPTVQETLEKRLDMVPPPPTPALRISISCLQTKEQISDYVACLASAIKGGSIQVRIERRELW